MLDYKYYYCFFVNLLRQIKVTGKQIVFRALGFALNGQLIHFV